MTWSGSKRCSQLLEITVSDVVTAPVGNCIELDAMREFHGPKVQKALEVGLGMLGNSGSTVGLCALLCYRALSIELRENLEFDGAISICIGRRLMHDER